MKNRGVRLGTTPASGPLPDRRPMMALVAVQGLCAVFLGLCKLQANRLLVDGIQYSSPFQQVMYTIDWAGAVLGLLFLVVAFFLPPRRGIDAVVAWLGGHERLVAAAVGVALAVLSLDVHLAYPFTMDEYAPVFQSQVFARGRLTGQWPPDITRLLVSPENIDWFFAVSPATGQVCSLYSPGHAILMTPFTFLGIPWAYNPALSGVAVLVLAAVVRRSFGEAAVGWAMLFMLASPVFTAYGISFYSMTSHFTMNLLYALLLLSPTLPRVAGAGLVGGFALTLHNPFPHFIFSLPWLGWLAVRRDRWTRLPLIAVCYAAVFLPIDAGWRHVQDSIRSSRTAVVDPAGVEQPGTEAVAGAGAAPVAAAPAVAPPARADVRAVIGRVIGYFSTLQLPGLGDFLKGRMDVFMRLMAWDAPGLVVLACLGLWKNRQSTTARLFALSGITTFLAYSLIPMSGGHGWGYRYFFASWSCLPVLAAGLAARGCAAVARTDAAEPGRGVVGADLLRAVGLAAVLSLAICLPVRLWQIHDFIADHLEQLPPKPEVLGGGDVVSFIDPALGYFRNDLIRNDPFLERGPYVLVSHGPDTDRMVIDSLAESFGLKARMTHLDQRGSTWVLEPTPRQEPAP
jgi:hypothetical protein